MKCFISVLPLLLMSGLEARAQSGLSGQWQETMNTGLNAELNVKATEATVSGTFTVRGRPMTISDGKVTKNTFTFKAAMGDQPEGFSGEFNGDLMVLWRDRNGKGDAVTLKRAPSGTLTGKWQGQTPNGMNLVMDLTASGQTVTGTLTRDDEATPITGGKISKNTFTFNGTLGGMPETIEGTFEGDTIKAWLARQGPERTVVLKRVVK
jgi:hypothetical protein